MYQNFTEAYRSSPPNSFGVQNSYQPYPAPPTTTSIPSYTNHLPGSHNIMARMNEASAFELLQHLDKKDLQHLLNDDSKLKDLIEDLPQVRSLQVEHDDLVATNKSLAEYNLSLQPRLESLKNEVASKYEHINSLKTDLAESKARLDSILDGRQSLETMLALMQTETAKSEEESEQLADDFCSGQLAVEEFLSEYIPKRTQSHLRRIKSERFAELIREGSSPSGNWTLPSQPAAPAHSALPTYPHGHSTPYPTSVAIGMPQPSLYPR
ncbi:unnamed protein product [Candidula unifasciata]|uniref:VPS37 C-terminal domain-containing protein n=1 Tax=Candidula unifasciata TaxID=100452 RepID=A0A8S4A3D4_9EUPU|nr:unnamed protein product [Candidula unifasciata]